MAIDGKVVYEVDYNTDKAEKNIKKLNVDLKATGEKLQSMGSTMTSKVTMPIVAGATAGLAAFTKISNELDAVKKAAVGVGAGVEGLQALQFAGRKAGIETDKMTDTLKKVQELVSNNSEAFWELGIQTRDANGNLRDSDVLFVDMLKSLEGMNSAQRNATLLALGFTEELTTINKALDENAGFLGNFEKGLDNAISAEQIAKFEEFNDKLEDIKMVLAPVGVDLAEKLLPYLNEFADWMISDGVNQISDVAGNILDFAINNKELVAAVAVSGPVLTYLGKLITFLSALKGLGIAGIAGALGGLGIALGGLANKTTEGRTTIYDKAIDALPTNKEVFSKEFWMDLVMPTSSTANSALKSGANYVGQYGPSGGTVSIGAVTVNAKTDLSSSEVGKVTDEIMEQLSQELQYRGVFK